MHRSRLFLGLPVLACLAFAACAGIDVRADYEKFKAEHEVQPITEPVDLVYRPIAMDQTMTIEARQGMRSAIVECKIEHETLTTDDDSGELRWVDKIQSMRAGKGLIRTDEPLMELDIRMTPKGEVTDHSLELPGFTSLGYGKDSPLGKQMVATLEAQLDSMRLPDPPVANGDVLCVLPAKVFFSDPKMKQTSGPKELDLKVDGQGMLDGRPVIIASGQMECTIVYADTGLLPYAMTLFGYRVYDLQTMGIVDAMSQTDIEVRGSSTRAGMTLSTDAYR